MAKAWARNRYSPILLGRVLISTVFLEGYVIKSIKNLNSHTLAQHVLFQEQVFYRYTSRSTLENQHQNVHHCTVYTSEKVVKEKTPQCLSRNNWLNIWWYTLLKEVNKRTQQQVNLRAGPGQSEPPHPTLSPWKQHSAHFSTARAMFKDAALREQGIVESIWTAYKTEFSSSLL